MYLFNAKGGVHSSLGQRPRILVIPTSALKARFIPVPESRLQRCLTIRL